MRCAEADDTHKPVNELVTELSELRSKIIQCENETDRLRQTEESIRSDIDFLNTAFDCILDGISILDQDLNIVMVNRTMEEWYRHMMPIKGKKCYQAYHCRDKPCEVCPSLRAMREKTVQREIHPRHTVDNRYAGWLEVVSFPLIDEQGNVTGVIEHVRDITKRKEAENALRESEEKYRTLVENINDMVWEMDRDYRVTYASAQTKDILGYEPEEVIGKRPFDFIIPEDLERFGALIERTFEVRAPMSLMGYRVRRKDGGIVYIETNGVPIFDDDGSMRGYCGINRDITDRMKAEESLRLMQYMIDQTEDEASLSRPDGRYVYVNDAKCRSLGYTREELLSMSIWDVDPDMTVDKWPGLFRNLKEKGSLKIETMHRAKDGRIFPSEIWTTYLDFHGNEYVCAFVRDVTERKQAETALLKSKERYRSLVENVDDWVWEIDENCRYIYSSPRIRDMLGYEPEEVIGKTPFDLMDGDEAKRVADIFNPLLSRRLPFTLLENNLVGKDGRRVCAETNGTPLFAGDGTFTGYIGIDRDISGRKQIEKSLKLTQFTMDRAGDMVLWVAPDARYIYANQAACQTFGYTQDEMMRMTTFDTSPAWTVESWASHWREVKERGSFTFERSLRKKDGSYFPAEISVNYIVYDGQEYNCSFIRDITERKRAEEALKESERKFRVLADSTNASIVLYRDSKYVYVNPRLKKITGYTQEELATMNFWDMVHPDHRAMVREYGMARQLGKDVPSTYEFKILTRQGETKWVEVTSTRIMFEGKPTILSTVFDITGRKRTEAELQEAKAQAELYLDLMGHDINNLNQIGISFLEMALETIKMSREERDLIARPLDALEASTRLIANVRKLQKVREGGLRFHDIDVGKMISNIIPRYSDVPGREIRISFAADCDDDCVVSANDLLDDVFSNIIGNAIKHSRGPLEIGVFVSNAKIGEREYCLVAIEDNGPGIPDEQKERLFTRFDHGGKKGDRKGLGMYLVNALVRDFHGRVWVEDRVHGDHTRGARFMIMLPAVGSRKTN